MATTERKRKSRFDVPPEDLTEPPTPAFATLPSKPTNAIEDFILKYGIEKLPVLPPSMAKTAVGGGMMTPFGLLEMGGMVMFSETDPQEALFKEKLRKALEKNLEFIKRKDALLATPSPQVVPAPKKTRIDIRNPTIARRTTGTAEIYKSAQHYLGIGAENTVQQTPKRQEPNSSIYVTGFPTDFTEDEIGILFSVLGRIKKIKLYANPDGTKKGDALITFNKPETVPVACAHYNGKDIGGGCIISVTKAVFGGEHDSNNGKQGKRASQVHSEEELRHLLPSNSLNFVNSSPLAILWNIYDPKDPSLGNNFLADLETDLREEFEKYGQVCSIQFPLHSLLDGTVIVQYETLIQATSCVENMRDRLFDGRTVCAHILSPLSPALPLLASQSPPPPPVESNVPPPPPPPHSTLSLVEDFDPSLDPSVVEAVQDVEDFLNSLL